MRKGFFDCGFVFGFCARHRDASLVLLIFSLCFVTYVIIPKEKYSMYLTDPKSFNNGLWLTPQFLRSNSDSNSTKEVNPDSLAKLDLNEDKNAEKIIEKKITEVVVATVACGKSEYLPTLLKSSVLFTLDEQTTLHFIIFTDQGNLYDLNKTMKAFVNESKSNGYARNFSYKLRPVWFPSPEKTGINWREMYANCSTQRLFFPSILPDVDSLIYLDADTIVMGNLTQVWNEFSLMNADQMVALGPDNMWTYHSSRKIPYVGDIGVNAGVTLMNLTRLRQFEFEKKVNEQYHAYERFINFADQDVINIIFHDNPKNIKVLKCSFNLIWTRCFSQQPCDDIRNDGVLILHGAGGSFKRNYDFPTSGFPLLYEKMKNFQLSESPIALLEKIKDEWNLQGFYCASATPDILVRNAATYFSKLQDRLPSHSNKSHETKNVPLAT